MYRHEIYRRLQLHYAKERTREHSERNALKLANVSCDFLCHVQLTSCCGVGDKVAFR